MTINIYHKGFLLYSTNSPLEAWDKAKTYMTWFSGIEVRKGEASHSSRADGHGPDDRRHG